MKRRRTSMTTHQGSSRSSVLMIIASVALIAALAIIAAMRVYQARALKQKFAEVINATGRYKTAIEICARFGRCAASGALAGLAEGTLGIPDTASGTYLARVAVASNGTITASANSKEGLAGETYVLTPRYVKGAPLVWAESGTCKTRAGGAIC